MSVLEYILIAWVLTLAYFVLNLTDRVKALEEAAQPSPNPTKE